MNKKEHRYLQIALGIEALIKQNVIKVGDKLPSLRTLAREKGVSLTTAQQSYFELESRGLIESRPQSGYYVAYSPTHARTIPQASRPILAQKDDSVEDIMYAVSHNLDSAEIMLSSTMLAPEYVPIAKLNKAIVEATRSLPDSGVSYNRNGSMRLMNQIAKRTLVWGGNLKAEDIITTGGSIDSISYCLLALARKGDVVAVESPMYFGILRLVQSLGLQVLELPTHPETGIDIDALRDGIEKKGVKICILVSNYSNPMGSCMPDEHKKQAVEVCDKYNIPLIEDDLYADLHFGEQRPTSCKTFDKSGIVLWCGSFSKTLVSGYRVGWVEAGRFKEQVSRTKMYHSMFSSTIPHEAIGIFLEVGRYDHHLRTVRQILHRNSLNFLRSIGEYFPEDTKVTRPKGSMNLWVELHSGINTVELYNSAMSHGISIAPGVTYSLQNQYNNCFKISFGMPWNDRIESAIRLLGTLAKRSKK